MIVAVEGGNVRFETAALLVGRQHGETGRVADCTYFVSSHICTRFEAVANSGDDRWWSMELSDVSVSCCSRSAPLPEDVLESSLRWKDGNGLLVLRTVSLTLTEDRRLLTSPLMPHSLT